MAYAMALADLADITDNPTCAQMALSYGSMVEELKLDLQCLAKVWGVGTRKVLL